MGVVGRSGPHIGTAREARTARAMVADVRPTLNAMWHDYDRAYAAYCDNSRVNPLPPDVDTAAIYTAAMRTGWQYLNAGSYRVALLSPTGVVYKVNSDLVDEYGGNGYELYAIKELRHCLPPGWAVPNATLYSIPNADDVVTAMPLIDTTTPLNDCWGNECTCKDNEGNKRLRNRDNICSSVLFANEGSIFWDLHCENVYPDANGTLWVIDVSIGPE